LYTPDDVSHCSNSAHAIPLPSPSSYLDISKLIEIVKEHGIDAVHPGYGFLSESAGFSEAMWKEANVIVIGPGWEILARTGDKLQARSLADQCNVPVLPALQVPTDSIEHMQKFAVDFGYPVIIKAVDGGGGRGIRIVRKETDLVRLMERALSESPSRKVFAEKAAIDGYRHVEVQIVGDGYGNVRHLWERECSIQRRFQKVVEFAPSSIRDRELVAQVIEAAIRMAEKVNYISLGTFEFLVRESPPEFYFLEVNPRLQVEHTITESICMGIDLVKLQFLIAMGQSLPSIVEKLPNDPRTPPPLHSLQLRLTSEDVSHNWSLSVGKITSFRFPMGNGIRVDTHILAPSTIIKTDFDSLLGKIIITSPTWKDVVCKAKRALEDTSVEGVKTNLDALRGIVWTSAFEGQACDTQWLEGSIAAVLDIGKRISKEPSSVSRLLTPSKSSTTITGSSSNVIFRKGDAWSIKMTPELSAKAKSIEGQPIISSHLQLSRVLRNEFPTSLAASVKYTGPSGPPTSYIISINATTASAGALASTNQHRRGDPGNPNHIVIPFPGQLMEVLVDEGDVIAKGDVVAVVRQMKMELEIRASRGGKVTWVFDGEEGEEVGEGILVAEVKDDLSRL
jgi:pyruvate carboxylase